MSQRLKQKRLIHIGMFALMGLLSCLVLLQLVPYSRPSEIIVEETGENHYTQVYLKEEDGLLVPLSIESGELKDSAERIQFMSGILGGKQPVAGFQAFYEGVQILNEVSVEEGIATLDLDAAFAQYQEQDELRLLEAIVWGATQFEDVDGVILQMDGEPLTEMPKGHTPLQMPLTREIGINQFEASTFALHDSADVLVYGTKKIEGTAYLIPRSRRVSQEATATLQDQVQAVISCLSLSSTLDSSMEENDAAFLGMEGDVLLLRVGAGIYGSDRTLKQDDANELVLSLCALDGVSGICLLQEEDGVMSRDSDIFRADQLIYNIVSF